MNIVTLLSLLLVSLAVAHHPSSPVTGVDHDPQFQALQAGDSDGAQFAPLEAVGPQPNFSPLEAGGKALADNSNAGGGKKFQALYWPWYGGGGWGGWGGWGYRRFRAWGPWGGFYGGYGYPGFYGGRHPYWY